MTKKYRQRGYQDDASDEAGSRRESPRDAGEEKREYGPRRGYGSREPRKVNMPSFREVLKCARCGHAIAAPVSLDAQCPKCSSDLRSCAQCTWFDTGSPFECTQPITSRVTPKDKRNNCTYYEPRVTVERETGSTVAPKSDGGTRQAFDDLFK